MTDKTPDQWTQQFMPSLSEWKGAFAADVTNAVAQAKTYTDAQIGTLPATVQANTTAIAGNTTTLATTTRNPATSAQNMSAFGVNNIALGAANTDAARVDQVGWIRIGTDVSAVGGSAVAFTLPAGYSQFRLEWDNLGVGSSSAGTLYLQVSVDHGTTYDSTNNYQFTNVGVVTGGTATSVATSTGNSFMPVGQSGIENSAGEVVFSAASKRGRFATASNSPAGITLQVGAFAYAGASTPTNLLIGVGGTGAFSAGAVRLLGWKQ